jgi:hypothetical protein
VGGVGEMKTKAIGIKAMPIELWWKIKALAAREECSVQQYIIDLLEWVVEKDKEVDKSVSE